MTLPAHAELASAFSYLDNLRETGVTNMYGARPYLIRDLDMTEHESTSVLRAWMETFDETEPDVRAAKALEQPA